MSLDLPYRERVIGGTTYRAHVLVLDDWAALTEVLADAIGEPVASLLRGDTVLPAGEQLRRGDVEVLVASLASRLTRKRVMDLVSFMAKSVRAGEHVLTSQAQAVWWPRHMADLAPVVGLFLEAQYTDFFEGVLASLPLAQQAGSDLSGEVSD
jgi:hypothetical protein